MPYAIELSKRARRAFRGLPASIRLRVETRIDALADDPRPSGVTNVVGAQNTYRIRVGDYRVVYEIQDDVLVVLIIRIGHRRDVYKSR